ncbi:MAG TPA: stage V sporulation protein AE [Clostridia bacterium]|nr:stage V sporulation protein AE [Clostridia bacterium]
MKKRKVILVTDGDMVAKAAIEKATANIGGRCISSSAGNPTFLSGAEIEEKILQALHDPVVVMVDDRGAKGKGPGERVMDYLLDCRKLDILGIVAVSSNGKDCNGLKIDYSVTKTGEVIKHSVDKFGDNTYSDKICGDTLSILRSRPELFIVGIGDPGKMDYQDEVSRGSPITTKALRIILEHS